MPVKDYSLESLSSNLLTTPDMHDRKSPTELIKEPGAAWEECEATLDERGTPLPLLHRAVWAAAIRSSGARLSFIAIRNDDGSCRGGFGIESRRSRALPGHRLLSVEGFGVGTGGLDDATIDSGVAALAAHAKRHKSILRVTVGTFAFDPHSRAQTADALRRNGFMQVPTERTYERTLMIDLAPSEHAILQAFHPTARRHIRSVAKHSVTVTSAESSALAPRLQELFNETLERTGRELQDEDWASFIRLASKVPQLSRIVVLKRANREDPGAVLAFARGCMHGSVAQYSHSGSTRPSDLKVPLSYALMWDLILWARQNGARWFDLGGITAGSEGSEDPLGGISDFKRYFSRHEIEVGQQWQLEPHQGRAAAARLISGGTRLFSRGLKRMRDSKGHWLKGGPFTRVGSRSPK